jgi:cell division protein FtsX
MAAIPEVQSRLGFFYHRSRISWSAIFGGMFVGLAVFVLAALLGMAIRFSVYTPSSGNVAPSFGRVRRSGSS